MADVLGARLIRLQCYEGIDIAHAVYEWNYPRQLLHIRLLNEASDRAAAEKEIFSKEFLLRRPLLDAIDNQDEVPPVLLIDEIDRSDEEFEAFLLELLSDFQISIPELGTISAQRPPFVVVTSNRTREVHDALKRRCLYHWIDYPGVDKEIAIVRARAPEAADQLAREVTLLVHGLRDMDLYKVPGVAETLDWARSLAALGATRLDAFPGRRHPRCGAQVPGGPGAGARGRARAGGQSRRRSVDAARGRAGAVPGRRMRRKRPRQPGPGP